MERTEIILVRHGQIDNPDDIVYGSMPLLLSEEGRNQVRELAERIKKLDSKIDKIYTSPYKRTLETSEILAEALDVTKIEKVLSLADVDVKSLEGAPLKLLRDVDFSSEKISELGYEIESAPSVIKRTKKFLDKVLEEDSGKSVLFVSHGDVTRLIIWFLKNPERKPPAILRDSDFLATAEAAILKFNNANFADVEFVRRDKFSPDNIKSTESS